MSDMITRALVFNIILVISVWTVWLLYAYLDLMFIMQENWPVSVTMIFGSFIAGATSEGGGAIAFPVFTKVLHISPQDAKVFSLAIQSVGMVAASMMIVIMRVSIEWRIILWASLGGFFGIVISTLGISPWVEAGVVKMLFTAMMSSFAFTLTLLNWKKRCYNGHLFIFEKQERWICVMAGLVGGMMSGLVGNGIDIICFSVMVLLFRLTEKVSTPTSVVLMAINSVVGFALHVFVTGAFTPTVENYWLAAVPVVVVGAPVGAYCCTRMNNKAIALLLISLIVIELISSLILIPLTATIVSISFLVFLFFSVVYFQFSKISRYTLA